MCFLSDRFQVENPETILCKFQFNCGIYSSQMSKLRESRFKWIGRGIEEEPEMRSRMQFCPGWTSCSSDFPKPRQDQACLKGYHLHTLDTYHHLYWIQKDHSFHDLQRATSNLAISSVPFDFCITILSSWTDIKLETYFCFNYLDFYLFYMGSIKITTSP